jgi:ribosomal protein S6--L-glutamate ligase
MNILILNSNPKCHGTRTLIQTGEKRGHKMIVADPSHFSPLVSDVAAGYDRLYDLFQKNTPRLQINQIDSIIPRISNNLIYNTFVLEHLSENLGIYSVQSAEGLRVAGNKFHTIQICSKHGIKTPLTVYAKSTKNIDFLIEKVGGKKFLIKYNSGSQGAGVMLMETRKSAISTIQGLMKNQADIILQEFIESKNQDIRAIVCGDKVICAMLRTGPKNDFRSNISLGGTGKAITLSAEDQNICVRASKAIGLEFSGVDLLKDKYGTTYVSEINGNAGTKIMQVTGINIWNHLLDYIENREVSGKTAPAKSQDHYYTQLKNENRRIWGNLKFFTENKRIQQLYLNTKDKDIKYRDTSGKWMQRKITNIYDLYRIVFDTFLIK